MCVRVRVPALLSFHVGQARTHSHSFTERAFCLGVFFVLSSLCLCVAYQFENKHVRELSHHKVHVWFDITALMCVFHLINTHTMHSFTHM